MIERLGSDVARELDRFGPRSPIAPIVAVWADRVGAEISRNAWPARIARDGTLVVHTSSSAWAFELGQLVQRLRESLGDVAPERIRFVVGPIPEPPPREPVGEPKRAAAPTAADIARGESLAAGIADERLRKVVAKTVAMGLARADSGRKFW